MTGIRARWSHAGLVLVLIVAGGVILPSLGARDVWAPDEPRHAEVARETLRDGHWWYPHVNSRPYADKPPLYFWLAAAAGLPADDVTELTARVPAAIAAILTVLLVTSMGLRLFGDHAGLLAGLALTTTWLFAWMARRVSLDVLLTMLVVLAVWCGLRAAESARAGRRRAVMGWLALVGAVAGLSIMTKGPVGLLFLAFALVPLAMADRRDGHPWPVGAGLALVAVFTLVLAVWLLPAHVLGGYDPLEVTREHVVERSTQGRHHARPPYYYLTTIPIDFLPWSLFAIPALMSAWKARRDRAVAFLLAWALGPLLVLSLIVEKRNLYLLPLIPAWILLIARWATVQPEPPGPWMRRAEGVSWILLLLLGALLSAGPWLAPHVLSGEAFVAWSAFASRPWGLVVAGLVLLAVTATAWLQSRRRDLPRLAVLAVAFAFTFGVLFQFLPRLNSRKSGRAMGETIARVVGNAPLGMYPRTWDAYVFYSRRSMEDLGSREAIRAFLAASPRPAFILVYRHDESVLGALSEPATEVAAADVGHREVVLYRVGAEP